MKVYKAIYETTRDLLWHKPTQKKKYEITVTADSFKEARQKIRKTIKNAVNIKIDTLK